MRDTCQYSHHYRQFSSGYERCVRCGHRQKIDSPYAV